MLCKLYTLAHYHISSGNFIKSMWIILVLFERTLEKSFFLLPSKYSCIIPTLVACILQWWDHGSYWLPSLLKVVCSDKVHTTCLLDILQYCHKCSSIPDSRRQDKESSSTRQCWGSKDLCWKFYKKKKWVLVLLTHGIKGGRCTV